MADLLRLDTLNLFLFFVVPGFVSLKFYDLTVPSARRNFAESTLEVISFSMINLALWYWLIDLMSFRGLRANSPAAYYAAMFVILFVSPASLALITQRLLRSDFLRGRIVHPTPLAWDYLFSQGKSYWILCHMKSGQKVGGYYSQRSFASSHPHPPEVYIEKLWKLDTEGRFVAEAEQTAGALIRADECHLIEFFRV